MSNYYTKAIRKEDLQFNPERWEEVEMLDDYFGRHKYGVRFPNEEVLKEEDVYFENQVITSTSYMGTTKYVKPKDNWLTKLIK